jgi:DNA-binding response OmpR family regulator
VFADLLVEKNIDLIVGTSQKNIKIFYADDDSDDAFFFSNAVQEIDSRYMFVSFPSGVDLLDSISIDRNDHNIIFLDLNMPQKNGIECLSDIRNNQQMAETPVFIISTSSSEKYKSEAREIGANDYIEKPSNFNILKQRIKEAIESTLS